MAIVPTTTAHGDPARRFATLVSNLPGMVYFGRADAERTMEFVSEQCLELTGYTAAELMTDPRAFGRLISGVDRQAIDAAIQAAVAARGPFTIEYRLLDRAGQLRHLSERGRVVGHDGETALIEGYVYDVTALTSTNFALGERVKELRIVYEITDLCNSGKPLETVLWTCVTRLPAGYCYPSEVAARLVLDGREYCSPNFLLRPGAPRQRAPIVAHGRQIGELEIHRVSGAGSEDYYLPEEQELLSAVADRIGGLVERERMLEALRVSERKARALYEHLPVPTVVWQRCGDDFLLVEHNAAARAATEGAVVAWMGRPLRTLLPGLPELARAMERCFEAKAPVRREVEHTTGDGSSRSLTVSLGFVPPDLVVAHVADVSVERRLQERLHQVQKMEVMGRMAAGVAHDFNNMLTVILACADILISGVQSDDPALVDLLEIRGAAERATALTRQLTTFSRQEVVRPGVVDLKRHILEVARMLEKLLGDERALSLVLTDAPCSIEIHPPHLDQVLFNLVANARDATAKGGHVTIETAAVEVDEVNAHAMGDLAPGPYLLLAVTDDGVGMDTTSQARAFEPFYTTKPPGMGTGMGLATVYGIVRQCGGHVAVFGAPGLGTTIRILFPRAATPAPERRATGAGEHRARATGTVLVVEDDESIRKLVQRVLTSAGYRVLTAANAAEARSLCESHKETLDLLLTDVVLPSQSGPELAAELPQIVPGLPVLFMSGYAERAAWATARLEPGMNFIAKPFTVEVLIRMVREILNQAVARPRA